MTTLSLIYDLLKEHFGQLTGPVARRSWWPLFSDDPHFEILVGAVLVQQTRWEVVEAAVRRLIEARLLSPQAMAQVDPITLAAHIRPAAFHSQKAPGLIAIAQYICEHYAGSTTALLSQPTSALRAELLALPRIGYETCDVTMLYAGAHPVFVVDEYTRRIFERVRPEQDNPEPNPDPEAKPFWRRANYEGLRKAIEGTLSQNIAEPTALAEHYADYHAQINEACVRYCLSKPRCDGPPARRVYTIQPERESYLDSQSGCPLRPICQHYSEHRQP